MDSSDTERSQRGQPADAVSGDVSSSTPSANEGFSGIDATTSFVDSHASGQDDDNTTQGATRSASVTPRRAPGDPCGVLGQLIREQYEVLELLGEGGMGAVYRVHNRRLSIDQAIKFVRQDKPVSAERRKRFEREIKLALRIEHQYVARIYDRGEHKGALWYVMEHCRGEDLHTMLKRGTFTWRDTRTVARQALEALHSAHNKRIIHRDIKPHNCMAARADDGTLSIKILDFGIAKLIHEHNAGSTSTTKLTEHGALVGTPAYMASELVGLEPASARSDLYALGVTLYELMSGRIPLWPDNRAAAVRERAEQYPPSLANHGVPPTVRRKVDEFIRRLMAPKPSDRFLSAADALDFLNGIPQELDSARPKRRAVGRWLGVGLMLVAVVAVIWYAHVSFAEKPGARENSDPAVEERGDGTAGVASPAPARSSRSTGSSDAPAVDISSPPHSTPDLPSEREVAPRASPRVAPEASPKPEQNASKLAKRQLSDGVEQCMDRLYPTITATLTATFGRKGRLVGSKVWLKGTDPGPEARAKSTKCIEQLMAQYRHKVEVPTGTPFRARYVKKQ